MTKSSKKFRVVKSHPASKGAGTTRRAKSSRATSARQIPAGKKKPAELKTKMSKQDTVLALLKRSEGATIAVMMEATGWQAHSVRGFLAGVVRRKLGLKLQSDKADGERVYRVTDHRDDGEVQAA
jgi:uncharacterized protein DUF3489